MKYYSSIFSMFLIFVAFSATLSIADLMDGLVAYYRLDGNSTDSVGPFDGTTETNVEWQTDLQRGQVLKVEGDGYILIEHVDGLILPDTGFSVSAWVNVSEFGDRNPIMTKESSSGGRGLMFRLMDHQLDFRLDSNDNRPHMTGTTALESQKWYHVAATFSPDDGKASYIGGKQEATDPSFRGDLTPNTANLLIGAYLWNGFQRFFNGLIDDVLIYYRVLTEEEIVKLASGIRPGEESVELASKLSNTWGALKQ